MPILYFFPVWFHYFIHETQIHVKMCEQCVPRSLSRPFLAQLSRALHWGYCSPPCQQLPPVQLSQCREINCFTCCKVESVSALADKEPTYLSQSDYKLQMYRTRQRTIIYRSHTPRLQRAIASCHTVTVIVFEHAQMKMMSSLSVNISSIV